MRHLLYASLAFLMASPVAVVAQTYPSDAVIFQDTEVRSGPGKNFHATSKLKKGDRVLVIRENIGSSGWLEIKPPVGSFSWINGRYVKQMDPRIAVVLTDSAPVMPGSTLVAEAPDREILKLTQGTIVIVVSTPFTVNNETWLPIQTQPSEVRYIASDAVKTATQVTVQNSAKAWTLANGDSMGNPQLAEAEKAIQAGDYTRAKQLLQQVANTTADPNQKAYALNRLAGLPQGNQVAATTASMQRSAPATTAFSPSPNPAPPPNPANLITSQAPRWSAYGRLAVTDAKQDNGQPFYVLQDNAGHVISYVGTNPGKSLDKFIGRTVTVYGPTVYRPDGASHFNYIVASHFYMP